MRQEVTAGESPRFSLHGHWSSRMAFILAVTGSAVGLGNIWKFPYIAGQNGGGAFVLVYLFCVVLIGMPVMMSEILIGRRGRRNPLATMALLGEEEGHSRHWQWVGALGVITGVLILSYYSVVAGWTLAYAQKSLTGIFTGATADDVRQVFESFTGSILQSSLVHTLFMGVTILVVARGVERGLEQAVKFMVPGLLVLMLVLLAYAVNSGDIESGLDFMFRADFGALTINAVLAAMGQAFFTLSLGMGALMAYGAYLPQETSIAGTSAVVVAADTLFALLAGMVIFPLVFANGLSPAEGPGLVFDTLPLAFGQMRGGAFFAAIFFVLLSFAAWTSALGLMEPAVAWLLEHYHCSRAQAAALVGGTIWILGFGTVLSFNVLAELRFFRGTVYDNIDWITSNIMLPVGGLFITIFAAWIMCRNSSAEELRGTGALYRIWRFLARFVAPLAITFVFLRAIGLIG